MRQSMRKIGVALLVLTALLPLLESAPGRRWQQRLGELRGANLVLLPALPLVLYMLVLMPRFEITHDLFGDWFTAADMVIGSSFIWARAMGHLPGRPAIEAYADRLQKRPHAIRFG